jgi:hypothetical protein
MVTVACSFSHRSTGSVSLMLVDPVSHSTVGVSCRRATTLMATMLASCTVHESVTFSHAAPVRSSA